MTRSELQKWISQRAKYNTQKREFDALGLTNFGNDVRGIYESLNSYLTGGWSDPTAGAAQKQSVNALLSRIAGVKNYMNTYASDYDANEYSTRLSELDELEKSLKEGLSYIDRQIEINSGFKNADEYNAAFNAHKNREELEAFGSAYADKDSKWLTNAASDLRSMKTSYDLGQQGAVPFMMPNGQMSDQYIDSIFKQYGANADNALDYADKFEQLANLRYADMFKTMDQDALSSYSSGLQGAMDAYSKAQNDFARFRSPENETKLRDAEKNLRQNFGVTPETASSKLTEAKGLINTIEIENLQKWASQQADFSEKSTFREGSYSNGVEGGFGGLINNTQRAKDDYKSNFGNKGWSNVNSIENPFVTSLKADKVSQFEIFQKYTTDEQRATYNYILNTIGEAAATKYAEALKAEFEKQNKKDTTEEWTQFSKENPWGASAASVFMNVTTGPFAGLSAAKDYLMTGTVDDDSPISTLHSSVDTVRSAVPQAWAEKYGWDDTGKGVASFFYGTGMSIADSTANNLVWGGYLGGAPGKVVSQVAMGLTAGASVARQAKEDGATDQQAFAKGVAAGVFEAIFEGLALDELLKIGGKQNIGKAILNQMKTEGLEEMGTEVANIIADTLIMNDQSEIAKKFDTYKFEGLGNGEAALRTFLDVSGEVGLAALGGAISGGVMGGTFSLLNVGSQKISDADLGTQIIRMGGVQALVDAGLKFGDGSEAYELASKLQKRSNHRLQQAAKKAGTSINAGVPNSQTIGNLGQNGQQSAASPVLDTQNKNGNSGAYRGAIDAADAGKLYRIIFTENKKQYFDHYTKVYEQKLTDMGVKGARGLARAVVLTISGENTTPEQTRLVANSREAQTLIKESGLALDIKTEFNPLQKKTTYQTDDGLVIISRKGTSAKYDVTLIKNEQMARITPKTVETGAALTTPAVAAQNTNAKGAITSPAAAVKAPRTVQSADTSNARSDITKAPATSSNARQATSAKAQTASATASAKSSAQGVISERTLTARSLSQVESIVETLREGASIGEVMSGGYTADKLDTDLSAVLSYSSAKEAGASEYVANTAAALSEAFSGNLRVYFEDAGERRRGVYRKEHDGTRSVVINPNSAADVDGVITHEVFHDLENTAAGRAFIELAVEHAKAQPSRSGDFENRYEEIYDLYVKDGRTRLADIPGEVGAKVASEIIGRESSLEEILGKMGEREASELVKKLKRGAATLKSKLSKVDKTKVKGRALAERRAARLVELYEKAAKQRALEDKIRSADMTGEIGDDIDGDVKTTRGSKTGKKPENQNVTTKSENKTQVSENKAAENKKASQNERYSLEIIKTDGSKNVVDPFDINKEDVMKYLEMSRRGQLENNSYFPVSAHTPRALIYTLKAAGVEVTDKPIAMQAKKARQSQIEGTPYKKGGITIRHDPGVVDARKDAVNRFENVRFDLDERYDERGVMERQPVAQYKPYSAARMREVLTAATKLITTDELNRGWKPGDPYFTNIKTDRASVSSMAKQLSDMFNFAQGKNATEEDIKTVAKSAADYLIANTYADDAEFAASLTEQQDLATRALAVLSKGLRRMTLGETEIGDIRAHYGKKKARSVITRWRATEKAKGTVLPSEIAAELSSVGVTLDVDGNNWNEADIAIALNRLYERSREVMGEKIRSQIGGAEAYAELRDKLAEQIYDSYRDGLSEVRVAQATAAAKVIVDANRARELGRRKRETGALSKAEWTDLTRAIGAIAKGYSISVPAVRDFAKKYRAFIEKQAGILNELITAEDDAEIEKASKRYEDAKNEGDDQLLDIINPRIAAGIYAIAEGDDSTSLTADELEALHAGIRNLLALDRRYDRVFKDGRWQDTDKFSKQALSESDSYWKNKEAKGEDKEGTVKDWFFEDTQDPEHVAARVGGYNKKSVLASAVHEIKLSSQEAQYKEAQYMRRVEEFFESHDEFRKRYEKERIEFKYVRENPLTHKKFEGSIKLTLGEFLSLYMTSKRKHAFITLAMSDIVFKAAPGVRDAEVTLRGNKPDLAGLDETQIEAITRGMGNGLISQINSVFKEKATADDKAFVALVEDFYANESKNDKSATDMMLFGYTNVVDGYYYPIARDKNAFDVNLIGNDRILDSIVGVNSFSFNQKTVERANRTMVVGDALSVMQNHAHQLAVYSTMTVPLQNVNRIYNQKISFGGEQTSLHAYINKHISKRFGEYFRNYLLDVQGSPRVRGNKFVNRAFGKIKSNYAKAVLSLNAKSVMTQFSTVFAMTGQVSFGSWAKGVAVGSTISRVDGLRRFEEMDKYSHGAAIRNDSNEQYLATGVSGKLSKATDKLMFAQVMTDRLTCYSMWNMCQYEIAKKNGLAIGTEENKIEAGKLLDEKILELQDTSSAATKTGIARDPSEIMKSFAMFRSSELKQWSRLCYMAGEMRAHGVKGRRAAFAKEVSAFLASKFYVVALALLWNALRDKWPKGKDDEPREVWKEFLDTAAIDMLGVIPFLGDLAEGIFGFANFESPVESVLNDATSSVKSFWTLANDFVSDLSDGKWDRSGAQAEKLISVVSNFAQLLGIPARNVTNLLNIVKNGVMSAVNTSDRYGISDIFGEKNYVEDLKAAIADGDTKLAETIIDLMLYDRTGDHAGGDAAHEIYELYSADYDGLLPSKTPTKVTITKTDKDGNEEKTEIELDEKQRKEYEKEYSKSTGIIKRLIASEAYAALTSEERASAISDVYDLCRERAKTKVLGADMSTSVAATYFVSDTVYIAARAHIKAIKADDSIKNKKVAVQRYLRSLGLSRIEQNVLLYVSGYRSETETSIVLRAVRALDLPNEEKFTVARALGFNIKGTRIVSE